MYERNLIRIIRTFSTDRVRFLAPNYFEMKQETTELMEAIVMGMIICGYSIVLVFCVRKGYRRAKSMQNKTGNSDTEFYTSRGLQLIAKENKGNQKQKLECTASPRVCSMVRTKPRWNRGQSKHLPNLPSSTMANITHENQKAKTILDRNSCYIPRCHFCRDSVSRCHSVHKSCLASDLQRELTPGGSCSKFAYTYNRKRRALSTSGSKALTEKPIIYSEYLPVFLYGASVSLRAKNSDEFVMVNGRRIGSRENIIAKAIYQKFIENARPDKEVDRSISDRCSGLAPRLQISSSRKRKRV
ncbi:uncharacterized protein V1516DRAFT_672818 [Lipomyces oligophaga]|uniref:uncharacterized protein n=1 Tax=Lipomyces oligophaga TaxID=45792 RepID=UPI0034CD5C7E